LLDPYNKYGLTLQASNAQEKSLAAAHIDIMLGIVTPQYYTQQNIFILYAQTNEHKTYTSYFSTEAH